LPELTRPGAATATPGRSVELLYIKGCPNYEALLPHLLALLDGVGATDQVRLHLISDEGTARRERFLGSPTVRVDGEDVEPGAADRNNFGLTCRIYTVGGVVRGAPLDEWVLDALARRTNRSGEGP
jgi:hypothetical protein